jgi:kexin
MKKNRTQYLVNPIVLLQLGLFSSIATAGDIDPSSNIPSVEARATFWYEGDKKREVWKSIDEIVFLRQHNASVMSKSANYQKYATGKMKQTINSSFPDAKIIESTDAWSRIKLSEQGEFDSYLQSNNQVQKKRSKKPQFTNVFYGSKTKGSKPLVSTGELIVHFNDESNLDQAQIWGRFYGLKNASKVNGDTFLFTCGSADNCLKKSNEAYHDSDVKYAYPNWIFPVSKMLHSEHLEIDDTLFPDQWYLENTGQDGGTSNEDINVADAWWNKNYGSTKEIIAIVDDGIQITHEDLKENVIPNLSINLVTGGADPSPQFYDEDGDFAPQYHGTKVAGLAAARGGNGIGLSGTAPLAGLVGIRLLGNFTPANIHKALTHKADQIDIYNNSWGPHDDAQLHGLTPLEEDTLKSGVTNGRGGKGSIFVFASGNGRNDGDYSNYDGYSSSPYTIAVAASNKYGKQAWYSESGSNLWVNAPSSDETQNISITEPYIKNTFTTPRYSKDFGGTSATAPQVSGVVALMLERNPNLGWRDVQHILAETAYKNDPADSDWVKNKANFWVNHKYGFGRVNASAAAQLASSWDLLPPQQINTNSKQVNISIPDNDTTGVSSSIEIVDDLSIDFVEVEFTSDHPFWGDLEITLISPEGTASILAENGANEGRSGDAYKSGWRFGVARLLGESSKGTWTLVVKDKGSDDIGVLQEWSVKVFGSQLKGAVTINSTSSETTQVDTVKASASVAIIPMTTSTQQSTDAEQLLHKCISKYPAVMGAKVGEAYSCQEGLLCQKTTGGGSVISITTIAVKPDNSSTELSYFASNNWYSVAFSSLGQCN